jgi:signal transduction histidine kinase/CheY-like chemotaxis protein
VPEQMALAEKEGLTFETVHRRRDGSTFPVEVSSRGGTIEGQRVLLSIVRDISERKQAEAERRQLQAQLQQTQKMESLGSLAGGVAHDMNNVLGAILGLASANLDLHPADSPTHRAFDTISQAARRGGQLVGSLLSFARQSPSELHDLDVNALVREEVRLLERTTLSRIRLVVDLASDLRHVRGDGGALTHAIMNLCVNAVDAMPETGTLTLRTRNAGSDWIEVWVEDTGCGMAPSVLEKAMDPFFTTKGVGKGTGLGLSLVYSTVKAHQGQLDLQSAPGRGTRVRLRLPVSARPPASAEPAAEPRAETSGAGLRVLLVDDDELIQSSMQALLELLGHPTTAVLSGEAALAELEAGLQPDVVILDMNMPGLGGAGTLPRLRALRPGVPVLLATGRADQAALDLIQAHPGVILLSKPFTMAQLRQHLEPFQRRG